ncbi:MAG: DMT family transporter [Alphaproteobacteria bacterium]
MTPAPVATPAPRVGAVAIMVVAMAIYAAADAVGKVLVAEIPVLQLVWVRTLATFAIWAPVIFWIGGRSIWRTARPGVHALRIVLHLASALCFTTALAHLPLAEAMAIFFVEPLLLTALSVPLLGEKVGVRRWAAIGVGFVGMLLVVRPGTVAWSVWAFFPLGSAVVFALYEIVTRKAGASEPPLTSFFWLMAGMGLLMAPAAPFYWEPLPVHTLWPLALLGLLNGCAQFGLIAALARAPATVLAPFRYGQLFWAAVFGFLVFSAFPDPISLAGMALIAGSGVYVWYRERQRAAP